MATHGRSLHGPLRAAWRKPLAKKAVVGCQGSFCLLGEGCTIQAQWHPHCQVRLLTSVGASLQDNSTTKRSNRPKTTTNSIHEKTAKRILQSQLGSLDSQSWYEADWILRHIHQQKTIRSVRLSLDLLDRCLREFCCQSRQKGSPIPLPEVLSTQTLYFSVMNWQQCAKAMDNAASRSALPSPTVMLDTIDYFRDYVHKSEPTIQASKKNLPLQPDIHCYSMIIDALAFAQQTNFIQHTRTESSSPPQTKPDRYGNIGWNFDATPAPVIAEQLLQRLLDENSPSVLTPTVITFNSILNAWARSGLPEASERADFWLQKMRSLSIQPTDATYGTLMQIWAKCPRQAIPKTEQLLQELKANKDDSNLLNAEVYLGVLMAYGRNPDSHAAERANQLLQELVSKYQQQQQQIIQMQDRNNDKTETDRMNPGTKCFLAVLNIHAQRGDAQQAMTILEQLQALYEWSGHHPDLCPDAAVFNCVLRAWNQSSSPHASHQAELLLHRMMELAERTGNPNLYPDIVSYNTVLHTYASDPDEDAVLPRAEKLFQTLRHNNNNNNNNKIQPNLITYNVYIHLLARSNAPEKAEAMIRELWDLYHSHKIDFSADATSYNAAIDAWKDRNQPERAEALFREMQQRYRQTQLESLRPTRVSYGSLITAWARSGNARKAQSVFDEMRRMDTTTGVVLRPSTIEYNATIHAWAMEGNVVQAEAMLNQCLQDYQNGNELAKPDVKGFTSVLNALAKQQTGDPWRRAKRAEAVLVQMEELSRVLGDSVKPNSLSFNAVLDCYSRCAKNPKAPEHAERILRHMERLEEAAGGETNVKASVISYTNVMNCWGRSNLPEAADRVEQLFRDLTKRYETTAEDRFKPSQFTYNAVIGAFARDLRRDDSLKKAMHYFESMVELYETTKDLDYQPGPMHFSVILSALSKRGLADEANVFFDKVLQICRDFHAVHGNKLEITSSFNGLIGAYAKSQKQGSAERAEEVLRRMQNLGPEGNYIRASANVRSFTSAMLAWSLVSHPSEKRLAVVKCEALLHEMLERAERGDASVMPNQFTFGTLLQVVGRSDLPDKQERARNAMDLMRRVGVEPDRFVKNALASILE